MTTGVRNLPSHYYSEMTDISPKCLHLVKLFEGLRLVAYRCPSGVPTIGYGHTDGIRTEDVGVLSITEDQANFYLIADLQKAVQVLKTLVKVPLNQNQFGALVSFTFNVGATAVAQSTLLKKLNAGEYEAIPAELKRWNKGGGKVLPGLVRRREAECELWNEAA